MPNGSWVASSSQSKPYSRSRSSTETALRNLASRWQPLLTGPLLWWALLWLAWAVRLWRLDASDLTFDEAATYYVTDRTLPGILVYLRGAVREHPPLYYLLIRIWMDVAGTSEYSLRFFAVAVSLIGIALTARLGRELARRTGVSGEIERAISGLAPALFLALLPFEVSQAQNARMYTMTIVLAMLSSLAFLPLLFGQSRRIGGDPSRWPALPTLMALVAANGLALFTHYYLALLIATQFMVLLLLRRWRALAAWSAAHGLVGLLGLVWLARAPGLAASLSEAWGRFVPRWPTVGQLRRLLAELFFGPVTGVPWNIVYGWGALVALGLLVAWWRFLRPSDHPEREPGQDGSKPSAGLWLMLSILLPVVLAFLMPEPPQPRYLTYLAPFLALALGQIPFLFSRRGGVVLAWVGLSTLAAANLGLFGIPRVVHWIKADYGDTVATVSAHARPGDGVLWYGPWQGVQFHYYAPGSFPPITAVPASAPPQLVPEEAEPVLSELLDTYQRLWVIPAAVDDVDPGHFVAGWLDANAHAVWTSPQVSLFLPPPDREAISLSPDVIFGGELQLARLSSDAQTVPAGEALRFALSWTATRAPPLGVRLDLSLLDENGNRWLQWTRVPRAWRDASESWRPQEPLIDRQGLVVPQGAPPGTFTVQLTVVDTGAGRPLEPARDGEPLNAAVDLFTFEVTEPVAAPVLLDAGDFTGPFTFQSPSVPTHSLTLVAYDLGGLAFQQGHPVPLRLHWLAPLGSVSDVQLILGLEHRSGIGPFETGTTTLVTHTVPLAPGYPLDQWSPGRLVSLPTSLSIPNDAVPGRARLTLAVVGAHGQPWSISESQELNLGELTVQERPTLRELPPDLNPLQVDFYAMAGATPDRIGLRGYRVEGEARPGGRLTLTYAWYATGAPEHIYSVFNHLLTADGLKVTQADGWPQGGRVLTNQWRRGEYILDSHTMDIPADAPPGPYLLAVGLFDAASGDRLQATQDGRPLPNDQWLLPLPAGSD